MMESQKRNTTPGGKQSTVVEDNTSKSLDSGELAPTCTRKAMSSEKEERNTQRKIKHKSINYFATININSLLQTGKLKQLTDTLTEQGILIAAVQETRFTDTHPFESEGFRILKGKVGKRVMKNVPHLGTAFIVSCKILDSIIDFQSPNGRLCTLAFRSTNKIYTVINVHAPTNQANKTNKEETDKFWEELEDVIMKIPRKHSIILLGDFNAQMGREKKFKDIIGNYPAHRRTNRNGERLVQLCKSTGLIMKSTAFKHLPRKQKTWTSPNPSLGEFQIDHVAISRKSSKEIQNVKVIRNAKIDSDHYLSKVKVKLQPKNTRKHTKTKTTKYDYEKLKNDSNFADRLETQNPENWEQIKQALIQTAKETIPLTKIKKHAWWNQECEGSISRRQQAWQKWNTDKSKENRAKFLEIRRETAKTIRNTKRNYDKDQMKQIEQDFRKNNSRNFYKTFKQNLNRYSPPTLCLKDQTGKVAYNDRDNCETLAKYFENLLNCNSPVSNFTFIEQDSQHLDSLPPTKEEIIEIIKSLKNNKASGEDSITAELWKHANGKFIEKLTETVQNIWITEKIPEDWTTALIHPLHKKGDKTDPNNYRGISLLPVTYKILSKALLNRAEEQLDPEIGEYQCGFRKHRSCIEQIFNLKSVITYLKKRAKEFVIIFVDFAKAYDSIDRETLYKILNELGLDNKTRRLINQTLRNTQSKVKFRGEISKPFNIKTGVRQGDGLSPLLFNCVLEKVIREWRVALKENKIMDRIRLGYKRNNLTIDCLAFADDLGLFADSIEIATKQFELLKEIAEKVGLQISFTKTMFISNIKTAPKKMKTKYGDIQKTDKFKYLGELIEQNVSEKEAIKSRVHKMKLAYHMTRDVYNKKSVSINAKLRHYMTVIRPEALYASECLTLNKKMMTEELEKVERRILRKILGPVKEGNEYRRRHNNELYRHIEKITDTIRKRRISFYGHLQRMEPERLTGRLFNYIRKLKMDNTWTKETEKDILELNITPQDIQNRSPLRNKLVKSKGFLEKPKKKTGATWTEERKEKHRERMREFWVKRKLEGRNQLK